MFKLIIYHISKWLFANSSFIFIGLFWYCMSCATPGQLTGGPKDEVPPKIDSLRSTPNFLTNFNQKMIELTFDEWIKLEDVINQVVISPLLTPRPQVTLRKKTVFITFDDVTTFRENATYTINFGSAVKDLTENNVPEDLRYVFSTGDFIDSLEISGQVIDILTKQPVEKVLVMLYDTLTDSVVYQEKPFYFARTDKEGIFRLQNIRADTFKIFVLEDKNANYRFDGENERIAFSDSLLIINDITQPKLSFNLFQEETPLKILSTNKTQYGLLKFTFNQPPQDLTFRYEADIPIVLLDYELDTLRLWYNLGDSSNWNIILSKDSLFSDTVSVNATQKEAFLEKNALVLKTDVKNIANLNPTKPYQLAFNHPLLVIDTSLIQLYENKDSIDIPVNSTIALDSISAYKKLHISYNWNAEAKYRIVLLPNTLTDLFGFKNKDTIEQQINIRSLKEFGNLNLTINSLDSLQQYVFRLEQAGKIIQTFKVANVKTWEQQIVAMPPGKYEMVIVTDINRNGKWDSGNYIQQIQPEPIITKELEALRANWDVEAVINISQ